MPTFPRSPQSHPRLPRRHQGSLPSSASAGARHCRCIPGCGKYRGRISPGRVLLRIATCAFGRYRRAGRRAEPFVPVSAPTQRLGLSGLTPKHCPWSSARPAFGAGLTYPVFEAQEVDFVTDTLGATLATDASFGGQHVRSFDSLSRALTAALMRWPIASWGDWTLGRPRPSHTPRRIGGRHVPSPVPHFVSCIRPRSCTRKSGRSGDADSG